MILFFRILILLLFQTLFLFKEQILSGVDLVRQMDIKILMVAINLAVMPNNLTDSQFLLVLYKHDNLGHHYLNFVLQ